MPFHHRSLVGTWPSQLWLVRHGKSEGNVADRTAQHSGSGTVEVDDRDMDVRLSALGQRQAQALGAWMAGLAPRQRPTAVLSSPYVRAAHTAAATVNRLGLPVSVDPRLTERDLGVFDGLTGTGIRQRHPEEAERRARLGKFS